MAQPLVGDARPDLAAFDQVIRLDAQQVVSQVRDLLGSRLVAVIAGVSETRAVHQWAEGQRGIKDPQVVARLRAALQAARTVADADADSAGVAQAWMQGLNPLLDDQSPAWLLREGDLHAEGPRVLAAARQFVAHG